MQERALPLSHIGPAFAVVILILELSLGVPLCLEATLTVC